MAATNTCTTTSTTPSTTPPPVSLLSLPSHEVVIKGVFPYLSWPDVFRYGATCRAASETVDDFTRACFTLDLSGVGRHFSAAAFERVTADNCVARRLCLRGCHHWVTAAALEPFLARSTCLTEVDLTGLTGLSDECVLALRAAPGLRSLSLKDCRGVSAAAVQGLVRVCRLLEGLDLTGCWEMDDATVMQVASRCGGTLRRLAVANVYRLTDASLTHVARLCPGIEALDISGCWRMSDNSVRMLVGFSKHLKELSVKDCRDVTEKEVQALRRRGVKIDRTPLTHLRSVEIKRLYLQI